MKLYIRNKPRWINFIHNVEEFKEFESNFIKGRKLSIGDLSQFSKPMMYRLLKFIEENPEVDCYSSKDITDSILLSRFVEIIKDPIAISPYHSVEDFNNSPRDYQSAYNYLHHFKNECKLRAVGLKTNMFNLIESL